MFRIELPGAEPAYEDMCFFKGGQLWIEQTTRLLVYVGLGW
ncbi:MAG: hypothetical protein QM706_06205 [Nitrospira sp.]